MRRILASLLCLALACAPLRADEIINPQTNQSALTQNKGQLPGTTTNDSACAGCVGEVPALATFTGTSLTNNTAVGLATLPLTAGEWDIICDITFTTGTATTVTFIEGNLSTTNGTGFSEVYTNFSTSILSLGGLALTGAKLTVKVGPLRVQNSGATSYYCNGYQQFGASTLTATGVMRAR